MVEAGIFDAEVKVEAEIFNAEVKVEAGIFNDVVPDDEDVATTPIPTGILGGTTFDGSVDFLATVEGLLDTII